MKDRQSDNQFWLSQSRTDTKDKKYAYKRWFKCKKNCLPYNMIILKWSILIKTQSSLWKHNNWIMQLNTTKTHISHCTKCPPGRTTSRWRPNYVNVIITSYQTAYNVTTLYSVDMTSIWRDVPRMGRIQILKQDHCYPIRINHSKSHGCLASLRNSSPRWWNLMTWWGPR